MEMKVLFQIRPGYREGAAGDSVQMLKTMIHLKELGVDVSVTSQQNIRLSDFDLIHIFNCTRVPEAYGFYKNAANQRKKIVVSPIFIDMHLYYRDSPAKLAAWRAENILRREMLQGSNMLLPNSVKEQEWIQNILLVDTPAKVIYLGADQVFFHGNAEWFVQKYGLKDFILCVGRLSPIKNQLSLIRAANGLDIPIVLVGPVNNKEYAMKCAEEPGGIIKYIPFLNQEELASVYQAARVHVQPSWFETVGLASLEAGASGTPVVLTNRGAGSEYFGSFVKYVDPGDINSIRGGILAALSDAADKNRSEAEGTETDLQRHIMDHFTWEKAARATLEAYEQVLSDNSGPRDQGIFYSQSYPI
jgi:glycosyltransferase involved in cell wall biosynthesis